MEIEEALEIYNELKKYRQIIGSIDTNFFFNFSKTVLQALESYRERYKLAIEQNVKDYKNSIPKKKIEYRLQELLNKLASAGLDGFYDEVRDIKQELLEDN